METTHQRLEDYAGTYHQIHDNVSIWIRELDDTSLTGDTNYAHIEIDRYEFCERTGGGGGGETTCYNGTLGFLLYDEDDEVIGSCNFDANDGVPSSPVDCDEWYYGREDCGGPQGGGSCTTTFDTINSFDIDNGWCGGYLGIPNTTLDFSGYPDNICLSDNRKGDNFSYHSYQYLYGTFKQLTDEAYEGLPVWSSVRLNNTNYEMYIYWDDYNDEWAMDEDIGATNNDNSGGGGGNQGSSSTDGVCQTENAIDPTDCSDCWDIEGVQSCTQWVMTNGSCGFDSTVAPDNRENYLEGLLCFLVF